MKGSRIEVAIEDAKQTTGVGQGPQPAGHCGRTHRPVRTGHHRHPGTSRATSPQHATPPWYRDKTQPSVADMLTKLRRVIIAAQYRPADPQPPTANEMNILRMAWENPAA